MEHQFTAASEKAGSQRDVASLMSALQQALALEAKFQPKLQLPSASKANGGAESGEITGSMRDAAAHVLRCLKVWFDLPSSVLLAALNLMDRFLSRIRARPRHLSVIAISALHLAACQWVERHRSSPMVGCNGENTQGKPQVPEPQDLVMISQCKCTAGDIMRMEKIVEAKLGCLPQEEPVTTLTFLSLYHSLIESALPSVLLQQQLDMSTLSCKLETICCDASYAAFPSSRLALALLFVEVGRLQGAPESASEAAQIANVLIELQQLLQIADQTLHDCMTMLTSILAPYDGYAGYAPSHRQRLTWKLSRRTLRQLRPTEKLVSVLPTIEENPPYGQGRQKRNRAERRCSTSSTSSTSRLPSPRKMRPMASSSSSTGASVLQRNSSSSSSSTVPLPFPTKEDLASFFDNFVPTPHPYPFRFLFGLEDEQQQTGPCTA